MQPRPFKADRSKLCLAHNIKIKQKNKQPLSREAQLAAHFL